MKSLFAICTAFCVAVVLNGCADSGTKSEPAAASPAPNAAHDGGQGHATSPPADAGVSADAGAPAGTTAPADAAAGAPGAEAAAPADAPANP
jgi:hypothetical protein